MSLHTVSHLLHNIHLEWSLTKDLVEVSLPAKDLEPWYLIFLTPKSAAIVCNSQSPFFSQTKQSCGWSDNNNSTIVLRAFNALALLVWTFIPSFITVPQAGTNPLSVSTIQTRQEAQVSSLSISFICKWQRLCIFIFINFAASKIEVPLGAETCLPLIVKLTKLIVIPPPNKLFLDYSVKCTIIYTSTTF